MQGDPEDGDADPDAARGSVKSGPADTQRSSDQGKGKERGDNGGDDAGKGMSGGDGDGNDGGKKNEGDDIGDEKGDEEKDDEGLDEEEEKDEENEEEEEEEEEDEEMEDEEMEDEEMEDEEMEEEEMEEEEMEEEEMEDEEMEDEEMEDEEMEDEETEGSGGSRRMPSPWSPEATPRANFSNFDSRALPPSLPGAATPRPSTLRHPIFSPESPLVPSVGTPIPSQGPPGEPTVEVIQTNNRTIWTNLATGRQMVWHAAGNPRGTGTRPGPAERGEGLFSGERVPLVPMPPDTARRVAEWCATQVAPMPISPAVQYIATFHLSSRGSPQPPVFRNASGPPTPVAPAGPLPNFNLAASPTFDTPVGRRVAIFDGATGGELSPVPDPTASPRATSWSRNGPGSFSLDRYFPNNSPLPDDPEMYPLLFFPPGGPICAIEAPGSEMYSLGPRGTRGVVVVHRETGRVFALPATEANSAFSPGGVLEPFGHSHGYATRQGGSNVYRIPSQSGGAVPGGGGGEGSTSGGGGGGFSGSESGLRADGGLNITNGVNGHGGGGGGGGEGSGEGSEGSVGGAAGGEGSAGGERGGPSGGEEGDVV
ncbi:hypothetical protein QBC41DRAFT_306014 [Cercophora samala]|uniref:Uncharacterized protein n=1 Tax=Cercophora samala TaxID=330535 RepID=A0AA40D7A1_9PEZI|nr:hypothetical protein QBC41DRAFT_306014 [Cercophora samala]